MKGMSGQFPLKLWSVGQKSMTLIWKWECWTFFAQFAFCGLHREKDIFTGGKTIFPFRAKCRASLSQDFIKHFYFLMFFSEPDPRDQHFIETFRKTKPTLIFLVHHGCRVELENISNAIQKEMFQNKVLPHTTRLHLLLSPLYQDRQFLFSANF